SGQRALGVLCRLEGGGERGGGADAVLVGQRQRKAVGGGREARIDVDAALGGLLLQCTLELVVVVAKQRGARHQVGRQRIGGEDAVDALAAAVGLRTVHAQAGEFALGVVPGQSVGVVDRRGSLDVEELAPLVVD